MNEEKERNAAQTWFTHSSSRSAAESCAGCRAKLSSSTEPKLLPCLHMMCKACIVVNPPKDKQSKECPMCGQSFNMFEVTDSFIFEDFSPKCGGCDETALSGWCKECDEALCSDCVSAHQRVKMTRNHTVIPQEHQSGSCTRLRCTLHKQEQLKFFCVTCGELTCKDCQLIDHRNHNFLLLEEAVVSQKDQLLKLLNGIREQKTSLKDRMKDLDERWNNLKKLKVFSKKQLHTVLNSLYVSMVDRYHQLSKELEGLCDEEEKSLKVMKTNLKKLEDRQEYIAVFIHKILSTKGQCILRHKMQIDKWAQRALSQENLLPDTVFQLSLSLDKDICNSIKNFGSFKVTRVPFISKGKYSNARKPRNAPKIADKSNSGMNSEAGAILSLSNTTSAQPTAFSVFQPSSDLPQWGQFESASLKEVQPTQGLTDTLNHSSSSSAYHNLAPHQSTQCNTAQYAVAQVGQPLPQSVSPQHSQQVIRIQKSHPLQSASLNQSSSSVLGQTVLKIVPSSLPQSGIVRPQCVLPQSQFGGVLDATAPPSHASCTSVTDPVVSVNKASFKSNNSSSLTTTQSYSLASNQSVTSHLNLTPFAQSNLASSSNVHPPIMNSLPMHAQQSVPQSQSSNLCQIDPSDKSMSYSQANSNNQSVNIQLSQSDHIQSNPSVFTVLNVPKDIFSVNSGTTWKFVQYMPVLTLNNGTAVSRVPLSPVYRWVKEKKSSQPTSGNSSCLKAPKLTVLPVGSNIEEDPALSSKPPLHAASIPSADNTAGQIRCSTQTIQIPVCELPVKAPADSVCEGNMSICSRTPSVAEEADSTLPTSTVPEIDAKAEAEFPAVPHQGDPLSSTSRSPSTRLAGLPASIKKSLSCEIKVPEEDAVLEHVFPLNAEKEDKTDTECALVEGMDESEEQPILRQDSTKTLHVSLFRLPVSGASLSQYRIVPCSQKAEVLLEEIEENQTIRRCFWIPAPPAAVSPSPSCRSECSLQADVLDCAVCLSAGASLLCAECGRSFHTTCHVPPIIVSPVAVWICSLCQDFLDDTDPFSRDRLKEPYLSLSDQRRCEQLLLTLMCENHSYLLYKSVKQTAGYVEFNLIIARLLGKHSPPYRSAAEMVSDLWALLDSLSANSKKKDLVAKLQSSFQLRLNVLFGKCLHASLLRPLSCADQTMAPETESDKEKTRKTLKRIREFLTAHCTLAAKKAHAENVN